MMQLINRRGGKLISSEKQLTAESPEKKYAESHRETLVHGLSGSLRLTLANSAVKMYLCNMSN